jgi:hypothetical protein
MIMIMMMMMMMMMIIIIIIIINICRIPKKNQTQHLYYIKK